MTDLFISGGRTRLARELYLQATRAGLSAFVLSARAGDRTALLQHYPDGAIVESLPTSAREVAVVVCALGLVHPASPDAQAHLGNFAAECEKLAELAAGYDGRLHLILVSTVIALLPPRERAYYAAFKNLAEAMAAAACRRCPDSLFSVLYPGHLVDKRGGSGLSGRLATPYSRLALLLVKVIGSKQQTARVVGVDARLWVVARAFSVLASALRPSFRAAPLGLRDGLPTQAVPPAQRQA